MLDKRISAKIFAAKGADHLMPDTLRAAIAMGLLLLTQTSWAQETRETFCMPVDVTSLRDRVQLRCSDEARDGGESLRLFAVSAAEPVFADRFLSTATAALANGRGLVVQYLGKSMLPGDPTPTCGKECRWVVAISIR